ncbi:hypothetical protein B0T25DRAFT_547537 [Lasiosphaeria hispida]|uniref:C2H2-type domain-containing protein n=1 Tax=Lasiosphaeria hispida TaxID=260671 RepID=A0AAJ0MC89_9PEZI|nr:hypothetical protein B0T25DRAFT_547537 [Lasiosphaeria hispida]
MATPADGIDVDPGVVESFITTPDSIIREALQDFKSALTPVQRDTFPTKRLNHVKVLIVNIQQHQERVKRMMNFSRIKLYLQAFIEFDNVCRSTKMAGEQTAELSAFIWGPLEYILQVSQEDSAVLDPVLDAYQKFGRRIPELGLYQDLINKRPSTWKCLAFMYQDLLEFYKKNIKFLTGRVWKKTFQFNWRDYDDSFKTILRSFDAHGSVLEKTLQAYESRDHREIAEDTYQRVNAQHLHESERSGRQDIVNQQLLDTTQDINTQLNTHIIRSIDGWNKIDQLVSTYENLRIDDQCRAREEEAARKEAQRNAVLGWMKTPSVYQADYHEKQLKVRADFQDTGKWILTETKILNWIKAEIPTESIMWLNGKKGAGKTVLTSVIIRECQDIDGFKTSYYYCREDNDSQNNALEVFKGLLRQLVVHNEDLLPLCNAKRAGGEQVLNNFDTTKALLEHFCDSDMNSFIVIDGLDECDMSETKQMVKFWHAMVERCEKYKSGKLRVLFVSQPSGDIRKLMHSISSGVYDLTPEQSAVDIGRYLDRRFQGLQEQFGIPEGLAQTAKRKICQRSEGIFLFAVLTVENLLEQPTQGDLLDELGDSNLANTLADAYDKIIERLERTLGPNQWKAAKMIFSLLAGAKRHLKWNELQAALSFRAKNTGEFYLDYEGGKLRNDIRKTCGALVHVLQGRVEFMHSTTRRHIIKSKRLDERVIQCDLAIMVLGYLTLPCFRPDLPNGQLRQFVWSGEYAFQDYAISNWGYHFQKLIVDTPTLFEDPVRGPGYERKLTNVLARFVDFHKKSIDDAVKKRELASSQLLGAQRSRRQQAPSYLEVPSSQASMSSQTLSRSSTQDSLSSPSPQEQQFPPQRQEADPADVCRPFQPRRFHAHLVTLWTHICGHQKTSYTERHKVDLPLLAAALDKIRAAIEEHAPGQEDLLRFYGEHHYKCQRVLCDYFHEGFDTKGALDNHSNRHDRPYECPVPSCSRVVMGFLTHRDRERHLLQFHPGEVDQPAKFVFGTPEGRQTKTEAKWECEICHKKFTRQRIRKEHMDAHYGQRNYACEVCGKRFTRSNDRNRHRDMVHVRKAARRRA